MTSNRQVELLKDRLAKTPSRLHNIVHKLL